MGACPRTPASAFFARVLGERRAIRRGGGGTQAHINSLPPGCNHHRNIHHMRSNRVYSLFSLAVQAPVFFRRVLGDRRAIRGGGGGAWAYINPLPQAAITIRKSHHVRSNIANLLKVQGWPLVHSHAPPLPPRGPAAPRPRFFAA